MIPQGDVEEFCGELEMRRTICDSGDGGVQLASVFGTLFALAFKGRKMSGAGDDRANELVRKGTARGRVEWVVRNHAPMKEADVVDAAMAPNDGHVASRDDDGLVRAAVEFGVDRMVREGRLARDGGTLVRGPKANDRGRL